MNMNSYRFSLVLLLSGVFCMSLIEAKCPRENRISSTSSYSSTSSADQAEEVMRWISVLSNERIEELVRDIRSIRETLNTDLTKLRQIPNVETMVRIIHEDDIADLQQKLDKIGSFFSGDRQNSIFDRILARMEQIFETLLECCESGGIPGNIAEILQEIIDQMDELENQMISLQSQIAGISNELALVHQDVIDIDNAVEDVLSNQATGGAILTNLVAQVNNVLANQAAGGVILNNLVQAVADMQVQIDNIEAIIEHLEDIIIIS